MALLSPDEIKVKESISRLLAELPYYIRDFKMEKENNKASIRSIQQYLYRYKIFFNWLIIEGIVEAATIKDVTLKQLDELRKKDIVFFIDHMKNENINKKSQKPLELSESEKEGYYQSDSNNQTRNRETTSVALMVSALKSLFIFLAEKSEDDETRQTYIQNNVMAKIAIPIDKQTSHNRAQEISSKIIQGNEMLRFIKWIDEGGYASSLTNKQQIGLFKRDRERDTAAIALILASGIRVGELARIEMKDINFTNQTIKIIRKGDKKDTIYIMDFAFHYLKQFIDIRNSRYPNAVSCPFLFTSYRRPSKAISIRAIQYFVCKYTAAYFDNGVYPHKLRHSFAVDFVKNGGDITILRDLLGHSDIQTTSLYVNMANSDKVDALKALNDKHMKSLLRSHP